MKADYEPMAASESPFYPGRRIKVQGLEVHEEMNGMKGTLIEEVQWGVWHVKLDGSEEKLLKIKNMSEIHATSKEEEEEKEKEKAFPMPFEEQLSLAGSWDDWTPHNMQWDENLQCHILDVTVKSDAKFGISK